MQATGGARLARSIAVLIAAVPFAFGVIRAVTTGRDYRYVLVAVAALVGAIIPVWLMGEQRRMERRGSAIIAAFLTAALLAGAVAWVEGARSWTAVWFVAGGFAVCEAVAVALYLSRAPRPDPR